MPASRPFPIGTRVRLETGESVVVTSYGRRAEAWPEPVAFVDYDGTGHEGWLLCSTLERAAIAAAPNDPEAAL